jgi:hypothetical protein
MAQRRGSPLGRTLRRLVLNERDETHVQNSAAHGSFLFFAELFHKMQKG